MKKIRYSPKNINVDSIIFCRINGEIKECKVIDTLYMLTVVTLDDIKKVETDYENDSYYFGEKPKEYRFKKWKYSKDWALTREELEK